MFIALLKREALCVRLILKGCDYMSTLEATVSLMENCTEDELLIVQQIVRQFIILRNNQSITKNQFMEELEVSQRQYANGQYCDAKDVSARMREKYGL